MALFTKQYIGLQTGLENILDTALSWGFGLEGAGLNTLKPVVNTAQSIIIVQAPSARFDLGSLGNGNGFSITGFGATGNGAFNANGDAVSNAGDINGDGIDDFIIGARGADTNGNTDSGQVYVIFGSDIGSGTDISLSGLDGTNGFVINGLAAGDRLGTSVSGLGDVNGDGFADFIIGAPGAFSNSGDSYVIFGGADGYTGNFDLNSLDGTNGFILYGTNANDQTGISVSGAGDINADGFADILVGGSNVDVNGMNAGEAYVVFGSSAAHYPNLFLDALDGSNGFIISGLASDTQTGYSVSAAGDVNGDGIDDILVGAPGQQTDTAEPGSTAGETYVVFGTTDGFANNFDLASLDGTNGFVINGLPDNGSGANIDGSGSSVSNAGDINGDGIDDILIGAPRTVLDDVRAPGQAYIVYGTVSGYGGSFDLADLDGSNGFVISAPQFSTAGFSVSGAGDINGDGYADFIVGAPRGFSEVGSRAGQSYVIYGSDSGFDGNLDLGALNGTQGFVISGINAGDENGTAVSGAGDVNGDGFADILVSSPGVDVGGLSQIGQSYIIYGSAEFGRFVATLTNGNDSYFAASGSEVVYGGDGDDIIDGLGGSDYFYGEDGNDDMFAGGGNDMLDGGQGDDLLNGGDGDDVLYGGAGVDILIGAEGSDELYGGTGEDYITGGASVDYIYGGDGKDYIIGGAGDDHLYGGGGEDIFVIMGGAGNDIIFDFEIGVDYIEFGDDVYNLAQLNFIQSGDDVLIKSANGITTLVGINIADISMYDFIFRLGSADPTGDKKGSTVSEPDILEVPEANISAQETAILAGLETMNLTEYPVEDLLDLFDSVDGPYSVGDWSTNDLAFQQDAIDASFDVHHGDYSYEFTVQDYTFAELL
ncbi:MAG: hypothetical protein L3J65_03780 [Robiginitomaculum sp.]|nr:hypothetical protein [Robiginitomaculum sp.]